MPQAFTEQISLKKDIIKTYKNEYIARPENDPKGLKGFTRKALRRFSPVLEKLDQVLLGDSTVKKMAVSGVAAAMTAGMLAVTMGGVLGTAVLAAKVAGAVFGSATAVSVATASSFVVTLGSLSGLAVHVSKPPKYEGSVAQKMLEADIENGTLVKRYFADVKASEMANAAGQKPHKLAEARSVSKDFSAADKAKQQAPSIEPVKKPGLNRKP